ncbi:triple tyrosine motif-containing protein [Winogradskyella sp.]|uniref:helix-turn-helix and ligand-binding sensor domain-containing protein n=1 Tax=Winogradskyella sp. TaxID=1883156 RepID=UPI0025D5A59B|nr:triple tyrosine motif-containing protein [Winogradskyella sp.]
MSFVFSQEIPPIEQFTSQNYNAGNQNWSIDQSEDKNIYVANNKGLLEYNGARWNTYKMPNQTIVRSVAVINDFIYTGSYMDFGYWQRDAFGRLVYQSLINNLEEELIEDEEFWNIIPFEEFVLFQSLDRIYIFNTASNSFGIIGSKSKIIKAFKLGEAIYFQEQGIGISKIENGKPILVTNDIIIRDKELVNIYEYNNSLLFHTEDFGFYEYRDNAITKWDITSNAILDQVSVYSSIRLRNGNFILGTISNGVIKLDKEGNLLFQINKNSGLSNNTVLSTFQDVTGNVWLGLDNGVNVLNLDSPYRVYTDGQGYLGTVYASEKTEKNLYLGTNQGLFYKPINTNGNFELVEGTKGQVWFLKQIDGTLFCGHDKGSFEIKDSIATLISSKEGIWSIKKAPNRINQLIQGSYNGLSIIEKAQTGNWKLSHKIEGFDISSRYFEFVSTTEILVSHEYKGVYKLKLDDDFMTVLSHSQIDIGKSIGSSLIRYKGDVLYNYEDGLFSYNKKDNTFESNSIFKNAFSNSDYVSGKLVYNEADNVLWGFLKNQLIFVQPGKLTDTPSVETIDLPSDLRQSKLGFENILYLKYNLYLLGTTDGYLIIDLDRFSNKQYKISINNASYSTLKQDVLPIDISSEVKLKNKQNNLQFNFSVPDYNKLSPSLYQYRLLGIYDTWSAWSNQSNVLFENLPYGDYTFEVKAKVGNNLSSNTASFNFSLEKPWYLKPIAIIGYIFLFLIIAATIQYFNRLYYKKQKKALLKAKAKELEIKDLENQRQLMAYKNKSLQQDIENKNRELGLSTMTLIRKNEFLNTLKRELNTLETGKELNKIIKIIDRNINNTEDWKFFEEAFNNADKDFLKKIKKKYSVLTPNDLKLCAYLRLNLSSKEIAPLLNISHRSVEVKRYRLRKKMKLPHEASLTNHILEI